MDDRQCQRALNKDGADDDEFTDGGKMDDNLAESMVVEVGNVDAKTAKKKKRKGDITADSGASACPRSGWARLPCSPRRRASSLLRRKDARIQNGVLRQEEPQVPSASGRKR